MSRKAEALILLRDGEDPVECRSMTEAAMVSGMTIPAVSILVSSGRRSRAGIKFVLQSEYEARREFEEGFIKRSNSLGAKMTQQEYDRRYVTMPCACGAPNCTGWCAVANRPASIEAQRWSYERQMIRRRLEAEGKEKHRA